MASLGFSLDFCLQFLSKIYSIDDNENHFVSVSKTNTINLKSIRNWFAIVNSPFENSGRGEWNNSRHTNRYNLPNHIDRVTSETRSSHLVTRLASPEILHVTVPLPSLPAFLDRSIERRSKRENDRNTSE